MEKQKMVTVSFEIPENDYSRFSLLEDIALSEDSQALSFFQSFLNLRKSDGRGFRRRRTASEIRQRAEWMGIDEKSVAR